MLLGEEVLIPTPWGHIAGKSWGTEGGPPVICIHGLHDNAALFDALLERMCRNGHFFLAIDLPGHGRSSHYPPTSLMSPVEYLSDLKRICDHYSWSQVTLLAHSVGCRYALYMASVFPNLVQALLLLDLAPGVMVHEASHLSHLLRIQVGHLLRPVETHYSDPLPQDEAYAKFLNGRVDGKVEESLLKALFHRSHRRAEKSGWVYLTNDRRNIRLLSPITTWEYHTSLLRLTSCPVLLLMSQSTWDTFQAFPEFANNIKLLQESLANKLTLFLSDRFSHDMPMEAPHELAPILSGYLTLKCKM